MKFRHLLLPLALMGMMLVSCGDSKEPVTPSSGDSTPSTGGDSTPTETWEYLTFVPTGELRIDTFDMPDGFNVKYGNTTHLDAINYVSLDDQLVLSVTKNLANEDSVNVVIIAEKQGTKVYAHMYLGVEGDHVTELFADNVGNSLVGYQRAYVAISVGNKAKWTKGLNTAMDEYLNIHASTNNNN